MGAIFLRFSYYWD